MVRQRNRRIHSGSGFFGSFDAPWSERSWIDLFIKEKQNPFSDSFGFKNPILDFLKETHPKRYFFYKKITQKKIYSVMERMEWVSDSQPPSKGEPRGTEQSLWLDNVETLAYGSRFWKKQANKRPCFPQYFSSFERILAVLASRFMASHKKVCKVRVLVRLRPESADYREKEGSKPNGIPNRCVRAVDSSTLELWNSRNSEESIRYRWVLNMKIAVDYVLGNSTLFQWNHGFDTMWMIRWKQTTIKLKLNI